MTENENWFESWFASPYYEILYHKRDETEAKQFINSLLNYLKPQSNDSILDLACGSGRHAVYLAAKGFDVTGIDLSENLIAQASKFSRDNLNFYVHDMRNEFRINYFNYTFNFFTSFGYFKSEHDNFRALENVCKGLKRGGIFVIDFFNLNYVKQHLIEEETRKLKDIQFKITRSIENGFVTKHISINHNGKAHHYQEKVQALTLGDFERYFSNMCLSISKVFGDYDLSPFDENKSERLIIIAGKEDA